MARSDTELIVLAATFSARMLMHRPSVTKGSQALDIGEHENISMNVPRE